MKKILMAFMILLSITSCSSDSNKPFEFFLEMQCQKYVIEDVGYSPIWGVHQKLIFIEHIENDVYNYKFLCQVSGNDEKTFRYYVVEIYCDIKSHDIIQYSIKWSAYYL